MVAASLNDAPERIKGWSLICGFKEQSFRDWSDFAKYVDDSAGSTVDHLRRTKKGNKLLALPGLKKKGLRRARPSPREGLMQMSGSEPLLHTVHWLRGGIPVSDFRRPMARPQSQPSQGTAISAIRSPTTLTFDEPERPRSSPSKSLLGGLPEKQRQGSHLQSPVPQQHSPRHRHTLAKTMLDSWLMGWPLDWGYCLDLTYSESPTLASASSKGPQLFQLAHELRIPAELARQATELFGRYSDGEGPDLFQRRLRMINFPALLCDAWQWIWLYDDHRTRRLAKKLGLEVVDVDDYRKAFDKFDTDGSGAIEIDEFQEILKHLLKLPPETELEPNRVANLFLIADPWNRNTPDLPSLRGRTDVRSLMLHGAEDKNHDDVVDFEEFCVFWSQSYGSGDNMSTAASGGCPPLSCEVSCDLAHALGLDQFTATRVDVGDDDVLKLTEREVPLANIHRLDLNDTAGSIRGGMNLLPELDPSANVSDTDPSASCSSQEFSGENRSSTKGASPDFSPTSTSSPSSPRDLAQEALVETLMVEFTRSTSMGSGKGVAVPGSHSLALAAPKCSGAGKGPKGPAAKGAPGAPGKGVGRGAKGKSLGSK
eukprot:g24735.t1